MSAGVILNRREINIIGGGNNVTCTCQCFRKDILLPAVTNVLVVSSAVASIAAAIMYMYHEGVLDAAVQQRRLVASITVGGTIAVIGEIIVATSFPGE